jgi:hypothetical protein
LNFLPIDEIPLGPLLANFSLIISNIWASVAFSGTPGSAAAALGFAPKILLSCGFFDLAAVELSFYHPLVPFPCLLSAVNYQALFIINSK